MSTKILTVGSFEEGADAAIWVWQNAGKPPVLRIEGFDGVGKSGLAKLIAEKISGTHVEGDRFTFMPEVPRPYQDCIRRGELDAVVTSALAMAKPIILDAVCLEEVLPSARWGRGFVIYLKRLSFNNSDPIWHAGLDLQDEPPSDEPRRGIFIYHRSFQPHARPDLILELPEVGHTISLGFNRTLCFDPEGATVVPSEALGSTCDN